MASDKPAEFVEDFFGDISLEVPIILTVFFCCVECFTLPKTNMDTQNGGFLKGNSLE